jgi:Transcription- and export-related complex subunit
MKTYANMIETLSLSMGSCSALSLDICAYTIIKVLSETTLDTLDNEANTQDWLKNIAKFAAIFFQKYCQVDIVGLLTYILNKMILDKDYN